MSDGLFQLGTLPTAETPADLLPPASTDPEQSLSSGSTTATVEFTHASPGGTAPITYAITVKDEAGSSVTPNSGSGLGPYVIPVAAGKSYRIRLRATDAGGQIADGAAMVHVAAAAADAGWVLVGDWDFTGLDVAVLTGTGHVQKGGVNYGPSFKVVDHGSNLGTVTAGSTGVVVDGLNINSALNLTFDIGASLPDNPLTNPVWVDIVVKNFGGMVGGSDGLRAGVVDSSGNFSSGTTYDVRCDYISGSTWNIKTETSAATSSWLGTETTHADNVISLLVIGGMIAQAFMQRNSTTPPSSSTINAGGRLCAKTLSAGGAVLFPITDFFVGIGIIWRPNATITRIRVHQMGGV